MNLSDIATATRLNYERETQLYREQAMLVLSRHVDEIIEIGPDIKIVVVDIRGDKVRLGIDAPRDVTIYRKEIADAIRGGQGDCPAGDPVELI